jgi:surface antigen
LLPAIVLTILAVGSGGARTAGALGVRPAVSAGEYGYPYPDAPDCNEQTGANCVEDRWGFVQGQCHSWVAYRLNELNAAELHGTFDDDFRQAAGDRWDNPPNWPTAARRAGIAVSHTPALGSVAWWSADGGHVAYVEAVNADGSIRISEMNVTYHNGFDFATLTRAGRWPDAFIHIADRPAPAGYWMLGRGGQVYGFGGARWFGNVPGGAVAIAAARDGRGYHVVNASGSVYAFGESTWRGGNPALRAGESVSTIAATPSGNGYWLFTNQGRAFVYGDARFFGDMANAHLNGRIVASAATATGKGYTMVGSDGGVFTFGDANFRGSTGAMKLNRPVVGIASTPDNKGYWLVASDGGVFAFGAPFRGSMGGARLNEPVNGLVAFGNGYLMVASDGGVFDFSNRAFFGSLGGRAIPSPIVGIGAFALQ